MSSTVKTRQQWLHDLKSFALGLEFLLEEPTLFEERPSVCKEALAQFERRCRDHLAAGVDAPVAAALAATFAASAARVAAGESPDLAALAAARQTALDLIARSPR